MQVELVVPREAGSNNYAGYFVSNCGIMGSGPNLGFDRRPIASQAASFSSPQYSTHYMQHNLHPEGTRAGCKLCYSKKKSDGSGLIC